MLEIRNKGENQADILIYGDIIDDAESALMSEWYENMDGYQWPKEIKAQLDELKGKDLNIYINSYGGSVAAGTAMANMIARHDGHTTAVVDSFCCSIATQIFFAADERKMPSNTYLMIHKPLGGAFGDSDDMRKYADNLDCIQKGLESAYLKCAKDGVTAEQIHAMTEAETWLTGADAAELFDIELLDASPALNCSGNREKLAKSLHKIPDALRFDDKSAEMPNEKPSAQADKANMRDEIYIAIAMAKGVMAR